jgi:hypothetical protein
VLLTQGEDLASGFRRRLADLEDASEEELDPALPIARLADRRQPVVILGTVGLEVGTEVQQRAVEDLPLAEQERDQEPPDPAVAVDST